MGLHIACRPECGEGLVRAFFVDSPVFDVSFLFSVCGGEITRLSCLNAPSCMECRDEVINEKEMIIYGVILTLHDTLRYL